MFCTIPLFRMLVGCLSCTLDMFDVRQATCRRLFGENNGFKAIKTNIKKS